MTKIKICGITTMQEIADINQIKPDYIGFLFAPSKRRITAEQAKQLKAELRDDIKVVGVFVNSPIEEILAIIFSVGLDVVQLHGDEDSTFIKQLQEEIDIPIIQAIRIKSLQDVRATVATHQLFDTKSEQAYGGSGQTFDWSIIETVKDDFFLAGGLNSKNVEEAIQKCNPFCVDVSSGVERDGKKDFECMQEFVTRVRRYKKMDNGRYGKYGGQYIPETLMTEIKAVEVAYEEAKASPAFQAELTQYLNEYANRPSKLYFAKNMTEDLGGAQIYLKREDLNHTGSHKINNVLGQTLLAKKMGKTRIIAETGAGQHGVATATACALMGLTCEIFMGEEDTIRQALNVYRMELLGATVHTVTSGTRTLKDAVNETMREWTRSTENTHYVLGSVMGPHPFPMMVRDFQSVISREAREQILADTGKLPAAVIACVGGGSNAIGAFAHFIEDDGVELIGCEAAGHGLHTTMHAATIAKGSVGIFHGMKSYFCQDEFGQITPVHSISAGLDYPGIGPEHAYLHDIKRAEYVGVTDEQAVAAFEYLSKIEGIIPAIESAHAVAYACEIAKKYPKDASIIINLSGRGDKDVAAISRYKGGKVYE